MAHKVCPWWMGYFLLSPLRRLGQDPERILGPLVEPGMTVLDVGCAMGFFSLPLARLVGEEGRVVCVDLEPRMLRHLERRAERAHLLSRLELRQCKADDLAVPDLEARVDLALLFAVAHEAPEQLVLLRQLAATLVPGGRVLLAEPSAHVRRHEFDATLQVAGDAGLELVRETEIARSHAALLQRPRIG